MPSLKKIFGAGDLAERRALSAYNNGSIYSDNISSLTKINKVLGKSNAGLVGSDNGSGTAAGQGSGIGAPGAEDSAAEGAEDADAKKDDGSAIGTVFGLVIGILGVALLIFFAPKLLILLLKIGLKNGLKFAAKKAGRGAANTGRESTHNAKSQMEI